MMRSSRAVHRVSFNWQKAVSRFFPESGRKYQEIDAKLDGLWREVYNAPEKVAPIDWAAWGAKIQDKSALEAIKKEFESKVFAKPVADVYMTPEQFNTALSNAKEAGEFSTSYAKTLEAEIAAIEKKKSEWYFYTVEALHAELPGYTEELARFREELEPSVPKEVVAALNTLSPEEIIASLKEGKLPAFPVAAINALPKESPIRKAINADFEAFRSEAKAKKVNTVSLDELIAKSVVA